MACFGKVPYPPKSGRLTRALPRHEVNALGEQGDARRGIEYTLAHGLARFEPSAQDEHKLARGFEPVPTESAVPYSFIQGFILFSE